MHSQVNTSNALHVIFFGMVDLIKTLLRQGLNMFFWEKFRVNRIEGEVGIYGQSSGSNYLISVVQIISSVSLARIKLFSNLDISPKENKPEECYSEKECMSEEDLYKLHLCFEDTSNLTPIESSALYHISGYVIRKYTRI